MQLDTVIFGGGAAGLWLLDELLRRDCTVLLLEAGDLGSGQTVASQGILHGGLKYTLQGLLTPSATAIREMPGVWRKSLSGKCSPQLTNTRVRSDFCYLWRTESVASRLGMIGAKIGLRVAPHTVSKKERPDVLKNCPGTVARMDEQVIAPASFIDDLFQQHRNHILKIDAETGLAFEIEQPGNVRSIAITNPETKQQLTLNPKQVIFTAGAGNAELRKRAGLSTDAMQRRPLQMVMARGNLPELNGHCVDGAKTRATITSDKDSSGRTVWQVGGQIAEDGVELDAETLIPHAQAELQDVIPGLNLEGVEWGTYRVDRAEATTPGNKRPETVQILREGNTITAWPTKLVLAPELAAEIASDLETDTHSEINFDQLADWPRPDVAQPPWENENNWQQIAGQQEKAA